MRDTEHTDFAMCTVVPYSPSDINILCYYSTIQKGMVQKFHIMISECVKML